MKYIENDGHVTREYEVKINTKGLEEIIRELSTKCYRLVNRETKVFANNEKEAVEKINAIDRSGIKVKGLTNVSQEYSTGTNTGLQVFECEYLYKQNTQLVKILETILSNYRSSLDFKNQNYREIDRLIQFENSDELIPYAERLAKYKDELLKSENNNELKNKITETLEEVEYNKGYDFALLNGLYNRAKECFELRLVAETVHYKDVDKNPKIYKLGTTKRI